MRDCHALHELRTRLIPDEAAASQPVWGQEFFFDFNPQGTLHIDLTNDQFLVSEEMGKIEITVDTILDGLQRAEGQVIVTKG